MGNLNRAFESPRATVTCVHACWQVGTRGQRPFARMQRGPVRGGPRSPSFCHWAVPASTTDSEHWDRSEPPLALKCACTLQCGLVAGPELPLSREDMH